MRLREHHPDALRVGIARPLGGYADEGGRSLFEGREIAVRNLENAGD
jgi:hypothetical protein